MASLKSRVELVERKMRFQYWLWHQRLLESLTEEQLEEYAYLGRLPEPLPEPLQLGASRLDGLDRKSLIRLWEEHEREYAGRSKSELEFYCAHGHWPEQACDERNCHKPESDEMVRRGEAKAHGGTA